jgi:hypothetical protein
MAQFRSFPHLLIAGLAVMLPVSLKAQNAAEASTPASARVVPAAVASKPFSADVPNREPATSIEFRPADQMTSRDRLLAANAESSIAEHAGMNGFNFEQGTWSYQQIVCPALPDHLFLQYTQNRGVGDMTVFSVSIPRLGDGRVRVIPILKRGYSLFSPAPINALTISAFNHIRSEERRQRSSNWLGNGLCYAALAGAHPEIASVDEQPALGKPVPAVTALLETSAKGGQIIRFADAAAKPKPMEWSMTFNAQGRLIKATHAPVALINARQVDENPPQAPKPVPQPTNN